MRAKGKRGRSTKTYETIGTQTSPILQIMAQVNITRLTSKEIEKYTSRCIPMNEAMEISKQNQETTSNTKEISEVQQQPNNKINDPSIITYSNFIKPITNNENANSTFEASLDVGNNNVNKHVTTRKSKQPSDKRGPRNVEDFIENRTFLSPVRDCPDNQSIAPDIVLSPLANLVDNFNTIAPVDISSINFNTCEQGTQTENNESDFLNKNITIELSDNISLINNPDVIERASNQSITTESINVEDVITPPDSVITGEEQLNNNCRRPKTVRFKPTRDISAIVTSRSDNNSSLPNASVASSDETNNHENVKGSDKYKKYIRITANTVHIHNHFYKQ